MLYKVFIPNISSTITLEKTAAHPYYRFEHNLTFFGTNTAGQDGMSRHCWTMDYQDWKWPEALSYVNWFSQECPGMVDFIPGLQSESCLSTTFKIQMLLQAESTCIKNGSLWTWTAEIYYSIRAEISYHIGLHCVRGLLEIHMCYLPYSDILEVQRSTGIK